MKKITSSFLFMGVFFAASSQGNNEMSSSMPEIRDPEITYKFMYMAQRDAINKGSTANTYYDAIQKYIKEATEYINNPASKLSGLQKGQIAKQMMIMRSISILASGALYGRNEEFNATELDKKFYEGYSEFTTSQNINIIKNEMALLHQETAKKTTTFPKQSTARAGLGIAGLYLYKAHEAAIKNLGTEKAYYFSIAKYSGKADAYFMENITKLSNDEREQFRKLTKVFTDFKVSSSQNVSSNSDNKSITEILDEKFYNGYKDIVGYDIIDSMKNVIASLKSNFEKKFELHTINGDEEILPLAVYSTTYDQIDFTRLDINKIGFINSKGEWVIKPQYDEVKPFSEGLAAVRKNLLWGYINKEGKEVISCKFGKANAFSSGLALVAPPDKTNAYNRPAPSPYVIINKEGTVIPQFLSEYLTDNSQFYEGMLVIQKNRLFGYMDSTGKVVVPPSIKQHPGFFRNGYAITSIGVIDKKGQIIFPNASHSVSGKLAVIKSKTGYGVMDISGNLIIDTTYSYIIPVPQEKLLLLFSEGKSKTQLSKLKNCDIADETGKIITRLSENYEIGRRNEFAEVELYGQFQDGLIKGRVPENRDRKTWAYLDKSGKAVISFSSSQITDCSSFSNGLASVKNNTKWGYIDKTGKLVINYQYEKASPFKNSLAIVTNNSKYGVIDKSGKTVIENKYEELLFSETGLIRARKGNGWGYIDLNGNEYFYIENY